MATYETEEQQVEAIKSWWKENGKAIIAGILLGVAGLGGWKAWQSYQHQQAGKASEIYANLIDAATKNQRDQILEHATTLKDSYKSTPYAALAMLQLAKLSAENNDLSVSAENLRWVIDHARQNSVRNVAIIRLARVLVANKKFDEADKLLSKPLPNGYNSLVEELRGDVFKAKGELDKARQSYDKAISEAGDANVEYLKMKRDDLGAKDAT